MKTAPNKKGVLLTREGHLGKDEQVQVLQLLGFKLPEDILGKAKVVLHIANLGRELKTSDPHLGLNPFRYSNVKYRLLCPTFMQGDDIGGRTKSSQIRCRRRGAGFLGTSYLPG